MPSQIRGKVEIGAEISDNGLTALALDTHSGTEFQAQPSMVGRSASHRAPSWYGDMREIVGIGVLVIAVPGLIFCLRVKEKPHPPQDYELQESP